MTIEKDRRMKFHVCIQHCIINSFFPQNDLQRYVVHFDFLIIDIKVNISINSTNFNENCYKLSWPVNFLQESRKIFYYFHIHTQFFLRVFEESESNFFRIS